MKQAKHMLVFLRPWTLLIAAVLAAGCGAVPAPTGAPATPGQLPSAAPLPTSMPAPAEAAPPTSAAAPSPAPLALTFAFPDDAASAAAAMAQIAAYTGQHPEVRVTAKPLPAADYARHLLDSADTNMTDIDLFVSGDSLAPALINRKIALDLQPLLASQPALKPGDFEPAALAAWQRGSALYGMPADVVPQVLFYNQDLFEAAGVAPPAPGWTWDDWLAKAKQLTVQSGGKISRYGTALTQWSAMVWGNGGELLNEAGTQSLLDSPEAAAGVQFAADMVNVHRVAPPPKDAGGPDPVELFQSQNVAMLPGASSLAGRLMQAKLPFSWAIAPLPAGKEVVSPISVSGVAISARSPNAQAALDFATWLVGPAGTALKLNATPFAAPALRTATARSGQISGEEAIMQALKNGRTQPQVEAWPEVKALVDQALKPVWQGKQSVQAAYRQVEPQVNALLKAG